MAAPASRIRRISDWGVRLVLPIAVFGAVLAVFLGELEGVHHELQLVLPTEAPPGRPIAAQAFLFSQLEADSPPTLVSAPIDLEIVRDAYWSAGMTLLPSPAGGASGAIMGLEPGRHRVRAVARIEGEAVATVEATLVVREGAAPAARQGRLARAIQQLDVGAIEDEEGRLAPRPFELRVRGGACVPESECALLVHVGAPGAAVRLVRSAAVTPLEPPPEDEETEGLVALRFVPHGPDVEAVVEAVRGGEPVGRRPVRVPIALGVPGVVLETPFPVGEAQLAVRVLGDRPGVIVDAYERGSWCSTRAYPTPADDAPIRLFGIPRSGLIRLQVRTDPFSSRYAAVRYVAMAPLAPRSSLEAMLPQIAALGGDAEPPDGPPALRFEWAVAPLEVGLRELPRAVSGRAADEARLASRQAILRVAALAAIVLGILVLALVFVRRGVDAALEAQQIMDATGDPELSSLRHRRRTLLSALAIVATALIAFLGAAALVIVRAHLLE